MTWINRLYHLGTFFLAWCFGFYCFGGGTWVGIESDGCSALRTSVGDVVDGFAGFD